MQILLNSRGAFVILVKSFIKEIYLLLPVVNHHHREYSTSCLLVAHHSKCTRKLFQMVSNIQQLLFDYLILFITIISMYIEFSICCYLQFLGYSTGRASSVHCSYIYIYIYQQQKSKLSANNPPYSICVFVDFRRGGRTNYVFARLKKMVRHSSRIQRGIVTT